MSRSIALTVTALALLAAGPARATIHQELPRTLWPEELGPRVVSPQRWRADRPVSGPLQLTTLLEAGPATRDGERGRVLVLVEAALADALAGPLETFADDLVLDGHSVLVETSSGGEPHEVRAHLAELHEDDLVGALLIGDLPVPWYEVEDDYDEYGYAAFPCDLFYMDLDGDWLDHDGNETYDEHDAAPPADKRPEIWLGRLPVTAHMGDAAALIADYLDRNHRYRRGEIQPTDSALVYVDDDWAPWLDYYVDELGGAFDSVTAEAELDVTGTSDYIPRLTQAYDHVSLYVHSSPDAHFFVRYGNYDTMIYSDVPPAADALFYNLFACSNADYTDYVYMAGVYVLQTESGLVAVGSTKTGSMLEAHTYYDNLRLLQSFGVAYAQWWSDHYPYDMGEVYWHYGMTLIGDPTLRVGYPTFDVTPAEVYADTRGTDPVEVVLELSNGGRDVLDWTASVHEPWVTVAPTSGELGGGEDELVLQLDPSGLDSGYHEASLVLQAPGATNNPLTVPIEFGALGPAAIRVAPDPLEVYLVRGDGEATATVEVSNGNLGRMAWTVSTDVDWIEPAADAGEVFDEPETLELIFTLPARRDGRFDAELVFSSPEADEDRVLDVQLRVGPAGCADCEVGGRTHGYAVPAALVLLVAARRFARHPRIVKNP